MAQTPQEMADVGAEFSHQSALFAWAAMALFSGVCAANDDASYKVAGHAKKLVLNGYSKPEPRLKWLHAIKNQGHGDTIRGGRSKAEGVKAGVFDLFLPCPGRFVIPRHPDSGWAWGDRTMQYPGLYIELKKPKKHKISPEQETFQADMRAAGYAAEFAIGWTEARDLIVKYLS